MAECPVCGADDPTASILVNNSNSQYADGKGITDEDLTFEVTFENGENVASVTICDDCYRENRHLE